MLTLTAFIEPGKQITVQNPHFSTFKDNTGTYRILKGKETKFKNNRTSISHAFNTATGEHLIYKRIRCDSTYQVSLGENEIRCLSALQNCKNVVQYKTSKIYIKNSKTKFAIITNYCDQDFYNLVKMNKLTNVDKIWVMQELIDAVILIHGRHILHRDIKLENIMLDKGRPTLIDFGYACPESDIEAKRHPVGSRRYTAPELFQDGGVCSEASDAWSLAVTLFCVAYGGFPPFSIHSEKADKKDFYQGIADYLSKEPARGTFSHMLWRLFQINPSDRPRVKDLPKIKDLDLDFINVV